MTPLKADGSVDMAALEKQMGYLSDAGVHGFFIGGTTAEGAYLTAEERKAAFRRAREVTGGRIPLYAVVLRPHTRQVIAELEDLLPLEPDYVAAVTPYYYGVSQATLIDHYRRIAEASTVPVLLYNIPQNTHNSIELETIETLAEHPNIVGIKDSSGSFMSFSRGMLRNGNNGFAWIQGEDLLDAPALMCGSPALVTGLGNVWIEPYVSLYHAAQRGDIEAAKAEQRKINALAGIIDVAGGAVIPAIKMAAALLGRGNGLMRIPGDTLCDSLRAPIGQVLRGLGLEPA
jgi:4-hydroxy-tetrahydrodipicolinate synthase